MRHGTLYGYKKRGCRCEPCAQAKAEAQRQYVERRRAAAAVPEHGLSGYNISGCRCDICTSAERERRAGRPEESKAAADRSTRRVARLNAALPATRRRQAWTEADFEILARDDLSLTERAQRLGRSYSAVASMSGKIQRAGRLEWRP